MSVKTLVFENMWKERQKLVYAENYYFCLFFFELVYVLKLHKFNENKKNELI